MGEVISLIKFKEGKVEPPDPPVHNCSNCWYFTPTEGNNGLCHVTKNMDDPQCNNNHYCDSHFFNPNSQGVLA